MRFHFYLYGNETGYLKILTKWQEYTNVVFNRYGNHGHKWNLAQIYLDFSSTVVYEVLHFLMRTGGISLWFEESGKRACDRAYGCGTLSVTCMNLLTYAKCSQI